MTTSEPIRGKVAQILNMRELVLSIGARDGVTLGMKFDVLEPRGEDIKDPDTGEVLGSLNRAKVRVRATRVEDKMTVAETFRVHSVNIGGAALLAWSQLFSRQLLPAEWVEHRETLKSRLSAAEDLSEEESYVKIGDPVRQVQDEEQDKVE